MKELRFDKDPEYADLWDACLYNFLYNPSKYTKEIINLFNELNISNKSKILDSSAGTGFISLHLRESGYEIECMDPMDDEIRVFKRKAKKLKVNPQINKISWSDIPRVYKNKKFDFIFCRGNSFIYAGGGWNKRQKVNEERSISAYKKTLQIFYNRLEDGGYLYLDKFPDNELSHNDVVCHLKIKGKDTEELLFYTKKIPEKRYREAMAIRRKSNGSESGVPNMTFDLKEKETEKMMREIGFKVKKLKLNSEKHFVAWLARR